MNSTLALEGGFAEPAIGSAFAFRALIDAMARPGTINTLEGAAAPAPMSPAAATAIATLCDPDTPVYLAARFDSAEVRDWIAFHTGAPLTGPEHCRFAVGGWDDLQPLDRFAIGTPEYPDRSATLIVDMPDLQAVGARLTGPGIKASAALNLPEVAAFQTNARAFPLGLDFIFTAGTRVAALPRTTRVE
ncbi:MAG: phosphonate C-P lyase system protein PhnH [Pseudomonadota bacterium]